MLFVRVDDLKAGMRLGKPIYNKNGVLLHDRGTKLTMQSIYSIKNFNLMGLYILEPAEPVPPMTSEDINFERFQTMAVFSIREDLDLIAKGKKGKGLDWLCSLVMKNYGGLSHKVTFMQSLRSVDDFIYKHSLNVAILSAIVAGKLGYSNARINSIVKAALLHDVGTLKLPLVATEEEDLNDGMLELIRHNTIELLSQQQDLDEEVVSIVKNVQELVNGESTGNAAAAARKNIYACIIYVMDAFDRMTAIRIQGDPSSEIAAIRQMRDRPDLYNEKVVVALTQGINIIYPGVCIELTNQDKGLVIIGNEEEIFEPYILSFKDNRVYNLSDSSVKRDLELKDVMKTMDNRVKLDPDLLKEYMLRG